MLGKDFQFSAIRRSSFLRGKFLRQNVCTLDIAIPDGSGWWLAASCLALSKIRTGSGESGPGSLSKEQGMLILV